MDKDSQSGWVQQPDTQQGSAGLAGGSQRTSFDLRSLGSIPGLREIAEKDAPVEMINKLKTDVFRVQALYQWDDVRRWMAWKHVQDGQPDAWCFYGCPSDMTTDVFSSHSIKPYGSFFPAVFGRDALYLYSRAAAAGRIALHFLADEEGLLMSCRLVAGRVFKTARIYPQATNPPDGYDTVLAPRGMDTGFGVMEGESFVAYDAERILIRYVAHIARR